METTAVQKSNQHFRKGNNKPWQSCITIYLTIYPSHSESNPEQHQHHLSKKNSLASCQSGKQLIELQLSNTDRKTLFNTSMISSTTLKRHLIESDMMGSPVGYQKPFQAMQPGHVTGQENLRPSFGVAWMTPRWTDEELGDKCLWAILYLQNLLPNPHKEPEWRYNLVDRWVDPVLTNSHNQSSAISS